MSFADLNRSIWSIAYHKLIQSSKLDHLMQSSKEFLLRNCYTIVNVNGSHFEEFTNRHQFIRPNDIRDKYLMDQCAKSLIEQFKPHVVLSYGFSDQFSFVINKSSNFCNRDSMKILSLIVSNFTSNYMFNWSKYFNETRLQCVPTFKAHTVMIPNEENLIEFLITKQHECYIYNLNATIYSALVGQYRRYIMDDIDQANDIKHEVCSIENYNSPLKHYRTEQLSMIEEKQVSNEDAIKRIKTEIDSISKINEYLFQEFGINYNNELELFRKGSLLYTDESDCIQLLNQKLKPDFLSCLLSKNKINENVDTNEHILNYVST